VTILPATFSDAALEQDGLSRRALVWMLLLAVFAVACAVSVPPSGGPEDRSPPGIVGTSPAADSAGVDPGSAVTITFSEPMEREGISRLVSFSPPVEIDRVRWDGNSLSITAWGGFHPDTTYLVTVRSGIRDRHRVATKSDFEFAFATSAALDTARISGQVTYRRKPTGKATVNAFVLPRDSAFTPETGAPDRQSTTDKDGVYTLSYLSPAGSRVIVWAYEDANNNGAYDPGGDHSAVLADTVVLTPGSPVRLSADIAIIDPNEPSVVKGRVINESGIDSMLVSVGLFAGADSLPAAFYVRCDSTGMFEMRQVRMGTYAFRAFVDMHPDSMCGFYPCGPDSSQSCAEPCFVHSDSLTIAPGDELTLPMVKLPPAATKESQ